MESKYAQVIRAAELYYKQDFTQQKISEMMGVSRPTVSRLLDEAKKLGIVEINLNIPFSLNAQLSEELRKALNIKDALVVDVEEHDFDGALHKVAEVASIYFSSILKENSTIGISWGRTVKAFVDMLEEVPTPNANIVQIVGGLGGGNPEIDGQHIAYKMSKKLSCNYHYIPAPAILSNSDTVKDLKEQRAIKETLTLAESVDIFVSGVASFKEEETSIQRTGYVDLEEKQSLVKQGGVGHLIAHIIDINGNEIFPFNHRVLSVPLSSLKNAEWSIGIAVSAIKADGLLAAMNGGYFNVHYYR